MPFSSKKQQAKCYALKAQGKNGSWNCDEWSKVTNQSTLKQTGGDLSEDDNNFFNTLYQASQQQSEEQNAPGSQLEAQGDEYTPSEGDNTYDDLQSQIEGLKSQIGDFKNLYDPLVNDSHKSDEFLNMLFADDDSNNPIVFGELPSFSGGNTYKSPYSKDNSSLSGFEGIFANEGARTGQPTNLNSSAIGRGQMVKGTRELMYKKLGITDVNAAEEKFKTDPNFEGVVLNAYREDLGNSINPNIQGKQREYMIAKGWYTGNPNYPDNKIPHPEAGNRITAGEYAKRATEKYQAGGMLSPRELQQTQQDKSDNTRVQGINVTPDIVQQQYNNAQIHNKPGDSIKWRDDFKGNFLSGWASEQGDKEHFGDLFNYYTGQPLRYGELSISKYAPTNATEPNARYVSYNNKDFEDKVLQYYNENYKGSTLRPSYSNNPQNPKDRNTYKSFSRLGNFKISQGEDETGKFVQYYDKFNYSRNDNPDVNKTEWLGATKPFEVYNRIYIDKDGHRIEKKQAGGYIANTPEELSTGLNNTDLTHMILNLPNTTNTIRGVDKGKVLIMDKSGKQKILHNNKQTTTVKGRAYEIRIS